MEKIAIGVPYEISIEPSVDIGSFDSELVLNNGDWKFGVDLKKIKGTDIDYTFIVPSELKSIFKKKQVSYCIYVYKENARFEVDDGKIQFIDEKDFKVQVKDNGKMRPAEKTDDKKEKSKDTPKPTPTPSAVKETMLHNPADFAESLIERDRQKEPVIDEFREDEFDVIVKSNPSTNAPPKSPSEIELSKILEKIEKKKKINTDLRNAAKKKV